MLLPACGLRLQQRSRFLLVSSLLVVVIAAGPVRGQDAPRVDDREPDDAPIDGATQPAGPAKTPRHTGVRAMVKNLIDDTKHLPGKENMVWAGFGGWAALTFHPLDEETTAALASNKTVERAFKPGAVLGQLPTLMAAAVTIYVVGRTRDAPKVSHVGMDLIQALAISEGVVQLIKVATQRQRPDGTGGSFPSGHSADTFAFATALERHLGWKGAVPAYIFSSYVAISRIPARRHWLSDAMFGASVGVIAGRTVTRHGREFPLVIAPTAHGGVMVRYVHRETP